MHIVRLKSFLFVVAAILLMSSVKAGGLEIDKLRRSVVSIETSEGESRTGMVIEIADEGALILTAYHDLRVKQDTAIWVKFYKVYDRWKGKLHRFDESMDIALISVEQPPSEIRSVRFGKLSKLRTEDQISAIGHTVELKWDVLPAKITSISGGHIIFSPPPEKGFSGAPLFDNKNGRLIGMVQREILENRSAIRGEALKSEIIQKILDDWIPHTSAGNKIAITWHYIFFGEMFPYMERPRWELSSGWSLGLDLEFARKGNTSPHKFGFSYSSFKSEPMNDNPSGTLSSTFIIPFWKYEPLFRIGRQYFGVGFACGLGAGIHSLEHGELSSGIIVDRPGVKDKHVRLAMLVDMSFKYCVRRYFSISLGWQLTGSTVEEFDIFYHDLYLAGEFKVGLL